MNRPSHSLQGVGTGQDAPTLRWSLPLTWESFRLCCSSSRHKPRPDQVCLQQPGPWPGRQSSRPCCGRGTGAAAAGAALWGRGAAGQPRPASSKGLCRPSGAQKGWAKCHSPSHWLWRWNPDPVPASSWGLCVCVRERVCVVCVWKSINMSGSWRENDLLNCSEEAWPTYSETEAVYNHRECNWWEKCAGFTECNRC